MNTYQEALNYISTFFSQVRGRGNGKSNMFIKLAESLTTLQELIDNYEKSLRLCVMETKEKIIVEKALDMLLDLSTQDNGICCTYDCPNKDEDIESGFCVGKCMTKEELKDYIFKKIESKKQ